MRVILQSTGEERLFRATGETTGATIFVDVRKGEDIVRQGPRPMELMAMSLAGCMGSVAITILQKKRIPFDGLRIEVDADRSPEPTAHFTGVTIRFTIKTDSEKLTPEALAHVLELAGKNCSAHRTLSHGVPITAEGQVEPTRG